MPSDLASAVPRYPDFIIGGMQKCGTTTLHRMLEQHPDIGIPHGEVHFFDADDPITHPDFQPYSKAPPSPADYARFFEDLHDSRLIGEDSTTYLASPVAPMRIKQLLPDAKLIFLLRDPTERAYSHYWHLVATGRAAGSFEHALDSVPNLISNSTYTPNMRTFMGLFDNVKVILFEEFVRDPIATCQDVCDFLKIEHHRFELIHSNRTRYPRGKTSFLMNVVGRRLSRFRYRPHFGQGSSIMSGADFAWNRLTKLTLAEGKAPPMRSETRTRLAGHLALRNCGLGDLLGRDLSQVWRNWPD